MSPTDHPHRPAWFDISTSDAPRARRFYQDLFGWPVNVLDETYALVGDDGGQPTGGIGQAGPDSPYAGFVAYFPVDDVDSALARAEQLGGTRVLALPTHLSAASPCSPTPTATASDWSAANRATTRPPHRSVAGMTSPDPATNRQPATGTWSLIHAERAALAADLAELTGQQWATRSLCDRFTVREVLAHLTAGASLNPVRWLAGVIRCRFDFDQQVAMRLAEQTGTTPADTLARFRHVITSTTKPPLPAVAMLGEAIVHGEDIRRPLGIHRDYPITTLTTVADYYQGSDLVVLAKGRVRGLRLAATDGPFTTGSGPLVSGTTLALIMATTGRTLYCDELDGDGVSTLRDRRTTARP